MLIRGSTRPQAGPVRRRSRTFYASRKPVGKFTGSQNAVEILFTGTCSYKKSSYNIGVNIKFEPWIAKSVLTFTYCAITIKC